MGWTEQLNGLLARNALAPQPIDMLEIEAHVATATAHIKDLDNAQLSNQSKFQLAYSAGHQMLTAGIKMEGYKPVNQPGHRVILYDLIADLFPGAAAAQSPMARAHNRRNKAEYEVATDVTDAQISELVEAVKSVKEEVDFNLKKLKKTVAARALAASAAQAPSTPDTPAEAASPAKRERLAVPT